MMYTTRIAPSPTGDFHIGTARTAYFNWLAAKASGGRFLLRIDDTDTARNDPASVAVIYDCLDWLGLKPDAIFRQSGRINRYAGIAADLLGKGLATRADNGAILTRNGASTSWHDMIQGHRDPGAAAHDLACNQVLIKADGQAVYHFASVMDDIDMGVNLVIRGMDHDTNTWRHAGLYAALEADLPVFAHVGLITRGGRKISKRDDAASLLRYRDDGIDADAMLNFLLRMGWAPRRDDKSTSLIDRDRAVEMFLDHGKMRSSPAALDLPKLQSFDRKYKARKTHKVESGSPEPMETP